MNSGYRFESMQSSGMRHIEVVDGQQRITTSFLMLNSLLLRARKINLAWIGGLDIDDIYKDYIRGKHENGVFYRLQYESQDDNIFFEKLLNLPLDNIQNLSTRNVYQKNLLAAVTFFNKKSSELNIAGINKMFNNLTSRLIFQVEPIESQFDVCAMFESINYRGKKLTQFEVLKNRLLYLGERLSTSKEQADLFSKKVVNAWSTAYTSFGIGNEILPEDDFLKIHALMYFGKLPKEKDALDQKLFKDVFGLERVMKDSHNPIDLEYILDYVENIKISSYLWAIQNAAIDDKEIPEWLNSDGYQWLKRIKRMTETSFASVILALLNLGASNIIENKLLIRTLKEIERFIFTFYVLSNNSSKTLSDEILAFDPKLYFTNNSSTVESLIEKIENTLCGYDNHDEYVGYYDRRLVQTESNKRFADSKKPDNMGWKKWRGVKYFLSEYEYFCSGKFIEAENYENLQVEHILPSNAKNAIGWASVVTSLTDEEKLKCYASDLGNFLLLPANVNARIKDKSFTEKKPHYAGLSFAHTQEISSMKNWSIDNISKRSDKLLEFMMDRWSIPWKDDSEFKLGIDLTAHGYIPQSNAKKKNR